MRLKTLGVIVVSALALFTMFYWLTDSGRLGGELAAQGKSEEEYALELFGEATDEVPFTANCAQCHGPDGTGGDGANNTPIGPNLHSASIAEKLKVNPKYVELVIRHGGVVVSGNVNSQMPKWSYEDGGPLNEQQIQALAGLVEGWATETASQSQPPVEDTPEAGQLVYQEAGCQGCHGANLEGGVGPALTNIGASLSGELPNPISQEAKAEADYAADPRAFLEAWIRDSSTNYNDGTATGMPPFPESSLSADRLQALITFLLTQVE
jgi:mono/diheme cytochrome c family protein